jgi:hypothetical protein
MNMHVNERHWRFFFGCGEGGGHGEGEGDCYSSSPMPWKEFLKINKFLNLDGKS